MLGVLRDLGKREDILKFDVGTKEKSVGERSSLKSPEDAESYYKKHRFDVLITVSGRRVRKQTPDDGGRTKRQDFFYEIIYQRGPWKKDETLWDGIRDALELWEDRLRYDPHPVGLIAVHLFGNT